MDGATAEEAVWRAHYALVAELISYMDDMRPIPVPSPPQGRPVVTVTEAELLRLARPPGAP